ncbi:hypothetical protein [Psychroserpens algicola]|uniref:Uncharacterized protein n=1 Tax=Psychroserpens algicola TaxID=1719034 RepID=A0ABT0H6D4_9FLAO|nr:hypothetical protein [Psychroserpens algicola]MCK8479942.1 hypothetical protein [Psychroserpens algicola]
MNSKLLFPLLLFCAMLASPAMFSQSSNSSRKQQTVNYNNNVNKPLTSNELALINEVYGNKTTSNVLNKPQRLKDIKNILRNRIEIKNIPNQSDQKPCTLLSEVPLMDYYVDNLQRDTNFNPQNFNPLKYLFNFYSYGSHMYRVDNTNYFIIIKSQHK